VFPLGATLVENDAFYAIVEGFAALGVMVTFFSGFAAFLALVYRDSAEDIGKAVNYGIAYGFIPGSILGVLVFYDAVTTI
jgi:hypothetical protein